MRKGLMLGIGLAVILLFATGAAAHSQFFFSFGFGVPAVRAFAMDTGLVQWNSVEIYPILGL